MDLTILCNIFREDVGCIWDEISFKHGIGVHVALDGFLPVPVQLQVLLSNTTTPIPSPTATPSLFSTRRNPPYGASNPSQPPELESQPCQWISLHPFTVIILYKEQLVMEVNFPISC